MSAATAEDVARADGPAFAEKIERRPLAVTAHPGDIGYWRQQFGVVCSGGLI
jgi:hypothetical protein